jgi:hypothetical protein
MRRAAAMVLYFGFLAGAACGSADDAADGGEGKEDRPGSAADRGSVEIGTSRRARITEGGQTHAFSLKVAAGSAVELSANPIASAEKTLKTTIKLFGPVDAKGAVPAQPVASSDDGSFAIHQTLAAAGEYRVVVGARTKRMTGSYDLVALCANHACQPEPVALTVREPQDRLAHAADKIDCEQGGCSGEVSAFVYEGDGHPSLAAVTEAVLKRVSQGDESWSTLDAVTDGDLEKEFEGMSLDDFLLEARSFSGNLNFEAAKVNGLVQIPIDDFGTDGFDQDLYVLHYPDEKAVVALLVKF